jgi:orotidine-5'-phosphate decarboxylase
MDANIPSSVGLAVREVARLGVFMLTLHPPARRILDEMKSAIRNPQSAIE